MMLPIQTVVIVAVTSVAIGAVAIILIAMAIANRKRKKKRRGSRNAASVSYANSPQVKEKKSLPSRIMSKISGIGTMNVILLVCGVILVLFTLEMIDLFKQYGMVPDTLITCVFAALTGECGVMGWIKTSKVKHQERKWQKEDMQEANMAAQMPAVDPMADGVPKE